MTDFFFRRNDIFPVGSSVGAYDALDVIAPEGRPPPAALLDTASMTAEGLTFTGLPETGRFWAVSEVDTDEYRWMGFYTAISQEVAIGPEGPAGPAGPTGLSTDNVVNVMDPSFGVAGDGSQDDTAGIQEAVDAAIAAGAKLFFPPPEVYYVISDTITLQPESGDLFRLDIEAQNTAVSPNFTPINFHWAGGNNKTIFRGINWHYSEVNGVHIQIEDQTGVVGWDLDCPTGNTFWVQFRNSGVSFQDNANADCIGWRIGHINTAGGGNSDHLWDSCYVAGTAGNLANDNIGWVWENQQCLIFSWVNCYASRLGIAWSGDPTAGSSPGNGGGAGMSWYGCGGTDNMIDYKPNSAGSYLVSGGRWETGNCFLYLAGGTARHDWVLNGVILADYAPADEIVFYLNNPCTLHLNGCTIQRDSSEHTAAMITVFSDRPSLVKFTGGQVRGEEPFFTAWYPDAARLVLEEVAKTDATWAVTGKFASRTGEQIYNVLDYGAVGDGAADDTVAIQAAINACGEAGGGTVYFPPGTYSLQTVTVSSGVGYCVYVGYDHVHLEGAGSASKLTCALNTLLIHYGGNVKRSIAMDDLANIQNRSWYRATDPPDAYDLTGTSDKGDRAVTLASSGDASNFTVGQYVVIRTGSTLDGQPAYQPVAEINQVRDVSGATIYLTVPAAHDYAQEYYVTGTDGVTSTTPTAHSAPYQAIPIPDNYILRDFSVRNMAIEHSGPNFVSAGGFADGLMWENLDIRCTGGYSFDGGGISRYKTIKNCRITHENASFADNYWNAADTTCTDHLYVDNLITADTGSPGCHIHEGCARITFSRNKFVTRHIDATHNFCSIRARAEDITIQDNAFYVGSFAADTSTTIIVDASCTGGGHITGNSFLGAEHPNPISSAGGDAWVMDNPMQADFRIDSSGNPSTARDMIFCDPDPAGASIYCNLAPVSSYNSSYRQTFKHVGGATYLVGVAPSGGATIDGATGKYLASNAWITITAFEGEFKVINQGGTVTNF